MSSSPGSNLSSPPETTQRRSFIAPQGLANSIRGMSAAQQQQPSQTQQQQSLANSGNTAPHASSGFYFPSGSGAALHHSANRVSAGSSGSVDNLGGSYNSVQLPGAFTTQQQQQQQQPQQPSTGAPPNIMSRSGSLTGIPASLKTGGGAAGTPSGSSLRPTGESSWFSNVSQLQMPKGVAHVRDDPEFREHIERKRSLSGTSNSLQNSSFPGIPDAILKNTTPSASGDFTTNSPGPSSSQPATVAGDAAHSQSPPQQQQQAPPLGSIASASSATYYASMEHPKSPDIPMLGISGVPTATETQVTSIPSLALPEEDLQQSPSQLGLPKPHQESSANLTVQTSFRPGSASFGGSSSLNNSTMEPTTPLGGSTREKPLVSPRGEDFTIMRRQELGSGAFGTVYKAFDNVNGRQAAVKETKLRSSTDRLKKKMSTSSSSSEFALLKSLDHPNIVSVYDFKITSKGYSQIFMEWMPGGSVRATMKQTGFRLHENVIRRFTCDALHGLAYLHSKGIVHRDIKPANMLLDNNGGVKLSDFGSSRVAEKDNQVQQDGGNGDDNFNGSGNNNGQQHCAPPQAAPGSPMMNTQSSNASGLVGTAAYLAPEVINTGAHSYKSDMWAIGASIFELATNSVPWHNDLTPEQINNPVALMFHIGCVQPPNHHPQLPTHLSPDLLRILSWCFAFDPNDRPSALQLLSEPYFADLSAPWHTTEDMADFQRAISAFGRRSSVGTDSEAYSLRQESTTQFSDYYSQ